jgi:hypothetical protein
MNQFFRGLALFIALCCLVWVGVLWHWQRQQHDMSVQDVVVYLLLLPVTVFVLALLARWAWRGAAAKAQAAATAVSASTAGATASAATKPNPADAQARHGTWQLLGAFFNLPAGKTPDELLAAIDDGKPMPELDAQLRDEQGLPVMTSRSKEVGTAVVESALAELCGRLPEPLKAQTAQGDVAGFCSDHLLRALALAEPVLAEAVGALMPWAQLLGADESAGLPAPQHPSKAQDARVRVLVAWPAGMSDVEAQLSERWVIQTLAQAGQGIVAPRRWNLQTPAAATPKSAGAAAAARQWPQADALFQAMLREERQDVVLLLAIDSSVSVAKVQALGDAQQLFSAARSKGRIPGEGAAALLLAPAAWPADPEAQQPAVHLHRAAWLQRDKSIDAPGRLSHDATGELVRQALLAATVEPKAVIALMSDADQHTARSAELFAAASAALPDLDASQDIRAFGHLCGHVDVVGMLAAVALAARQTAQKQQPCVALSLSDPQWRGALVTRLGPLQPPPAASQASA